MGRTPEQQTEALAAALDDFQHAMMQGDAPVVVYSGWRAPLPVVTLEAELQAASLADNDLRSHVAKEVWLNKEYANGAGARPSGTVLRVRQAQVADVRKRIESISRKAARHGLPPISVELLWQGAGKIREWYTDPYGEPAERTHTVPVAYLLLHGEYPRVEGFTVIGKVAMAPGGRTFRGPPESFEAIRELLEDTSPFFCDVCNTTRRRTQVFIVRDDTTGGWITVGGECAKAFRGVDLEAAIGVWADVDNLRDEEQEAIADSAGKFFSTQVIFAAVLAATGGDPARTEKNSVTHGKVLKLLQDYVGGGQRSHDLIREWWDEAQTYAADFQTVQASSDFTNNVIVAFAKDDENGRYGAPVSTLNMAVWGPKIVLNERQKGYASRQAGDDATRAAALLAAKTTNKAAEDFQWLVRDNIVTGAKVQGWVTFERSSSYESAYGWKTIFVFTTADGFPLVWFTTSGSEWLRDDTRGKSVLIKATVKDVGTSNRGEPQGVLTRVTDLAITNADTQLPGPGRSLFSTNDVYAEGQRWVHDRRSTLATGVLLEGGGRAHDVVVYLDEKTAKKGLKAGF